MSTVEGLIMEWTSRSAEVVYVKWNLRCDTNLEFQSGRDPKMLTPNINLDILCKRITEIIHCFVFPTKI